MKKLTKIDGIGQADLKRCFDCSAEKAGEDNHNCGVCEAWYEALDLLHEYQTIGTPEAFRALKEDKPCT